jgi:hypothetical protein
MYLIAFVFDQLFQTIHHKEITIFVYIAEITSLEPSIRCHCRLCCLCVLKVAWSEQSCNLRYSECCWYLYLQIPNMLAAGQCKDLKWNNFALHGLRHVGARSTRSYSSFYLKKAYLTTSSWYTVIKDEVRIYLCVDVWVPVLSLAFLFDGAWLETSAFLEVIPGYQLYTSCITNVLVSPCG